MVASKRRVRRARNLSQPDDRRSKFPGFTNAEGLSGVLEDWNTDIDWELARIQAGAPPELVFDYPGFDYGNES